jgi:hypothetical protein
MASLFLYQEYSFHDSLSLTACLLTFFISFYYDTLVNHQTFDFLLSLILQSLHQILVHTPFFAIRVQPLLSTTCLIAISEELTRTTTTAIVQCLETFALQLEVTV